MSIQSEIERLQNAKENLKTAITGKGVTVPDSAKLDEYSSFVNGIQQGVEGGIDVSATTAVESDVLSTAKFYKADGSFVSGSIQTVTPTLSGNKFTVNKGYVANDTELAVPESTITETEDKVTVGVGYVGEAKEYNLGTDNVAGVLVDDGNGGLMVQKLSFDGTVASDSGEPLTADNFYMFNTGKDEPDYGGNVDLSFVTAGAGDILSGKVGTDKDGNPVNGTIATVTPSLSGNKFTVGKGYVSENKELTVAEAKAPTVSGNVVTVYPGYMGDQKTVEIPKATATLSANVVTIPAGYHDKNILTVPEAPSPTVDGNTVTIHAGYVPTEQTIETEGGSGGSMEIYKCVEADGMTWWVVSGCGSIEANGRYYQGEDVKSDYGESYKIYYQKDGSCSLEYEYYDGRWVLKSGGTTLYRNDNWDYYNGDPSQCTSWITDSGVDPVPTIAKETTTGNGWEGKKYDTETGAVADTITELEYKYNPPKIGKFYTADGVILCEFPMITDYLYHPSVTEIGDLSVWGTQPKFGTWKGVPCMIFDGTGAFYKTFDSLISGDFTFSCFWYMLDSSVQAIAAIGTWNPKADMELLYDGSNIKFNCWQVYSSDVFLTGNYFNAWYTMTVTYSASSRTFIMYLDGNEIGRRDGTPNLDPKIAIGANFKTDGISARDGYMTGYIGDFSIWNRVLTAEEVLVKHKQMMSLVTE